jgi:hypothetical protein
MRHFQKCGNRVLARKSPVAAKTCYRPFGARRLAGRPRQPLRARSVIQVSGTFCHPCLRVGQKKKLATPAERAGVCPFNGLALETDLNAEPDTKELLSGVTNLAAHRRGDRRPRPHADLSVFAGSVFLGTIRRLFTRRFLALDANGTRVGIFETVRAAARALPRMTDTTTIKPKPAQRGRAGLGGSTEGRTRLAGRLSAMMTAGRFGP